MKRKLSPWCKAVKIAMIQKDWGVADLAQAVKMTKEYTSAVINGRVISEPAVKVISDVLNIEQTALTSSELCARGLVNAKQEGAGGAWRLL